MKLSSLYTSVVLKNPIAVIFVTLGIVIFSIFYSFSLELDASGESLVLENDKSLNYYRQMSQRYASDDFIIITFKPTSDLFSQQSIKVIRALRNSLLKINSIESVNSILDVPIIYESGLKLSEITGNVPTFESGKIDNKTAYKEFKENPLYRELLLSKDGTTTALQALFKRNTDYDNLLNRRLELQTSGEPLTNDEKVELENIRQEISASNRLLSVQREKDIKQIREIIDQQRAYGKLYLGGIPMITVDMIQFIKHDLLVFGSGVFIFLILILSVFFNKIRWVLLPMLICAITGLVTIGFMGFNGWFVTVISSNFLSILLIITLSLTIHLIVRYRDLQLIKPDSTHIELIQLTTASMARPCFYTILTTAVAFASLVVSEIRPVIDFGWIMVLGLCIAFIVSFTVMPACLTLLGDIDKPSDTDRTKKITLNLAKVVHRNPLLIIIASLFLILLIGFGITKLEVENRFINNFKSDTEIYQGMKIIDHQLGGTMPLDIIIDPDKEFIEVRDELATETNTLDDLFFDNPGDVSEPSYWLNPSMISKAKKIHAHLESYSVIGKVVSIVTSLNIVEKLNGAPFDEFELALLRKRIPDAIADDLVKPYMSDDSNQIRFSVRIIESDPTLNRKNLLSSIHHFLTNESGLENYQIHLTGMMVLYNNMLQSLFRSQILTIGAVFTAIFFTFILLFRKINLALIAIVPNMFSAILILGIMGWTGVPLDMMTITIAAITIGISVDDTIHYIHRLQHEYPIDNDYNAAIDRCHGSIGKAMYYTSIAIMAGFALLSFSNFIPTVYFGVLTGFAMFVALVGDLLLLPAMVLIIKPKITGSII